MESQWSYGTQWRFGGGRCHERVRERFGGRHGFRGRFGGFMGEGGRGFRAARMLASGDLQLIVLVLLSEKPRHGYEIIKALEEHSSGVYIPSPGVVYPALTYVEELGYATAESEGNKKLYKITDAGREYLAKNRAIADETLEQLSRFGKKVAKMQKHFADEEAESDLGSDDVTPQGRDEWRKLKIEFGELRHELKAALREKIEAPPEEKKRVLDVLKKAIQDIRGK
jgi:DNA-binding PadR family transcriptional regulator